MSTAPAKYRCSAIARESGEHLYGTAPVTPAWLLIEQPGSWGPDALRESAIDPQLAEDLDFRSRQHGFKVILIRRSAARPAGGPRSCFLARAAQGETWMERVELYGPSDLMNLDLSLLERPNPPALGEPCNALWAVCTHGRRDPCCAEYGRKLIRAYEGDDRYRENLWESSHQGGHRFAANMALFPHGLFYGQVEPDAAGRIIDSYRDGRLVLDGYRGRSAFDTVTQAADFMVRREIGLTGIDDLVPVERKELGDGRYSVTFEGVMGLLTVTLEQTEGAMRPESCNKPKLTPVKQFHQLDLSPDVGESPTF